MFCTEYLVHAWIYCRYNVKNTHAYEHFMIKCPTKNKENLKWVKSHVLHGISGKRLGLLSL